MWATLIVHPHHISSLKLMHMDHIDCVSKKLMCARVIYFMLLWMSCDYLNQYKVLVESLPMKPEGKG